MKTCKGPCGLEKPEQRFSKWKYGKDGRQDWCKDCKLEAQRKDRRENKAKHRAACRKWVANNPEKEWARKLKYKFGVTTEQYTAKLLQQNNSCAICGGQNKHNAKLHVDHNHTTGQIRGLLCNTCNVALGSLKEDRSLFLRAMEYLDRWEHQ